MEVGQVVPEEGGGGKSVGVTLACFGTADRGPRYNGGRNFGGRDTSGGRATSGDQSTAGDRAMTAQGRDNRGREGIQEKCVEGGRSAGKGQREGQQ